MIFYSEAGFKEATLYTILIYSAVKFDVSKMIVVSNTFVLLYNLIAIGLISICMSELYYYFTGYSVCKYRNNIICEFYNQICLIYQARNDLLLL